jgi:hypothetical protein
MTRNVEKPNDLELDWGYMSVDWDGDIKINIDGYIFSNEYTKLIEWIKSVDEWKKSKQTDE